MTPENVTQHSRIEWKIPKRWLTNSIMFFIKTAHNIDIKIPRTTKSPLDYLICSKTNYSFFISPVMTEEIKIIISSLKNGKAVGPYSIPVYLLKLISEYIAIPLCDIRNYSFVNGIFPDWMKLAKVILLYKKNSPEIPSNYRPIFLLSVFSKLVEKLMHTRLYTFLEKYDILHSLQFGFHNKHSTLHALISLTESIKKTIDDGMFGCGVFIDLQKPLTLSIIQSFGKIGILWCERYCA